MCKVDDLIAQYCPNGVKYIDLGEICTLTRGRVMSKDYLNNNIEKLSNDFINILTVNNILNISAENSGTERY